MLTVLYYVAASVDGYIATQGGGVEWLSPFEGSGEDYGFAQFYASVDALLLGSRTYEQSLTLGTWPYPGKPCWVFSQRPLSVRRPEVTLTTHSPRQVVAALAAQHYRRLWLVGGATLAASCRAEGVITDYIVSIMPLILGGGIPLFSAPGPPENLALADTRSYANGVVQLWYVRDNSICL
jgi:dihydrofolate reductase